MWKCNVQPDRTQMTKWRKHLPCYVLRLQTHTYNMYYLLLFQWNDSLTNATESYVTRTMELVVIWGNVNWFNRVKLSHLCVPFSLCANEFYILFALFMCVFDMNIIFNSDYFFKQNKPLRLCNGNKLCVVWRMDTTLYVIRRISGFIVLNALTFDFVFSLSSEHNHLLRKFFNLCQRNFNTSFKPSGKWQSCDDVGCV